jgi:hypothetical protein
MAKKLSVSEAVALYQEKKSKNLKTSWGIFKRRMSTKDFPMFKSKIEDLNE